MLEINKIYNEDCLESMKLIPDNSIDLIVTDPPYKITSGGRTTKRKINMSKDEARNKSGELFEIPKFSLWMPECYRILKDSTHAYFMTNSKNLNGMLNEAQKVGFTLHEILIWDKQMAMPTQWYLKNVEYILFMRKGRAKPINNLGSKVLFSFKTICGNKVHPSEKPIELMKLFVENSSQENETVLDPFMGAGSTALACKETGRNYIGFELDKHYHDIANKRISEEMAQIKLF